MERYFLGLDIGGTSFKSGVINQNNHLLHQNKIATNPLQSNSEALNNTKILIDDAINRFPKIETIGVGLPCVVHKGKIIMAPNLSNWNNIDFKTFLHDNYNIPASIDNDANAAAVAELLAGTGKELTNFFYITLGTGIGGAIIINRKVYHGNIGGAGEIGHLIINENTTNSAIPTYRNGILEEKIGRQAVLKLANKLIENNPDTPLFNTNFDVADISKYADIGDSVSIECLTIIGKSLGKGIVSINHILDISNFIIGGGISQSDILLQIATQTAQDFSLPSVSKVNIMRAKFLQNTGIIGAALLGKMKLNKQSL